MNMGKDYTIRGAIILDTKHFKENIASSRGELRQLKESFDSLGVENPLMTKLNEIKTELSSIKSEMETVREVYDALGAEGTLSQKLETVKGEVANVRTELETVNSTYEKIGSDGKINVRLKETKAEVAGVKSSLEVLRNIYRSLGEDSPLIMVLRTVRGELVSVEGVLHEIRGIGNSLVEMFAPISEKITQMIQREERALEITKARTEAENLLKAQIEEELGVLDGIYYAIDRIIYSEKDTVMQGELLSQSFAKFKEELSTSTASITDLKDAFSQINRLAESLIGKEGELSSEANKVVNEVMREKEIIQEKIALLQEEQLEQERIYEEERREAEERRRAREELRQEVLEKERLRREEEEAEQALKTQTKELNLMGAEIRTLTSNAERFKSLISSLKQGSDALGLTKYNKQLYEAKALWSELKVIIEEVHNFEIMDGMGNTAMINNLIKAKEVARELLLEEEEINLVLDKQYSMMGKGLADKQREVTLTKEEAQELLHSDEFRRLRNEKLREGLTIEEATLAALKEITALHTEDNTVEEKSVNLIKNRTNLMRELAREEEQVNAIEAKSQLAVDAKNAKLTEIRNKYKAIRSELVAALKKVLEEMELINFEEVKTEEDLKAQSVRLNEIKSKYSQIKREISQMVRLGETGVAPAPTRLMTQRTGLIEYKKELLEIQREISKVTIEYNRFNEKAKAGGSGAAHYTRMANSELKKLQGLYESLFTIVSEYYLKEGMGLGEVIAKEREESNETKRRIAEKELEAQMGFKVTESLERQATIAKEANNAMANVSTLNRIKVLDELINKLGADYAKAMKSVRWNPTNQNYVRVAEEIKGQLLPAVQEYDNLIHRVFKDTGELVGANDRLRASTIGQAQDLEILTMMSREYAEVTATERAGINSLIAKYNEQNGALLRRNELLTQSKGALLSNSTLTKLSTAHNAQYAQAFDKVSTKSMYAETRLTKYKNTLKSLVSVGRMVGSLVLWDMGFKLLEVASNSIKAKTEMESYTRILGWGTKQTDSFNNALNKTTDTFQKMNKYNLGETVSSLAVEFNLTEKEAEKALPVVSMVTSEYLRAGRTQDEAALAMKDVAQGEFQRLSRETGVGKEELKLAGWNGNVKDLNSLLTALERVGESRHWDKIAQKATSLGDVVQILENRFGEFTTHIGSIITPVVVESFNLLSAAFDNMNIYLEQNPGKKFAAGLALIALSIKPVLGFLSVLKTQLYHLGVVQLSHMLGLNEETVAIRGFSGALGEQTILEGLEAKIKANNIAVGYNEILQKQQLALLNTQVTDSIRFETLSEEEQMRVKQIANMVKEEEITIDEALIEMETLLGATIKKTEIEEANEMATRELRVLMTEEEIAALGEEGLALEANRLATIASIRSEEAGIGVKEAMNITLREETIARMGSTKAIAARVFGLDLETASEGYLKIAKEEGIAVEKIQMAQGKGFLVAVYAKIAGLTAEANATELVAFANADAATKMQLFLGAMWEMILANPLAVAALGALVGALVVLGVTQQDNISIMKKYHDTLQSGQSEINTLQSKVDSLKESEKSYNTIMKNNKESSKKYQEAEKNLADTRKQLKTITQELTDTTNEYNDALKISNERDANVYNTKYQTDQARMMFKKSHGVLDEDEKEAMEKGFTTYDSIQAYKLEKNAWENYDRNMKKAVDIGNNYNNMLHNLGANSKEAAEKTTKVEDGFIELANIWLDFEETDSWVDKIKDILMWLVKSTELVAYYFGDIWDVLHSTNFKVITDMFDDVKNFIRDLFSLDVVSAADGEGTPSFIEDLRNLFDFSRWGIDTLGWFDNTLKPTIDTIVYWLNPSNWFTAGQDTSLGIIEWWNTTVTQPINNWYTVNLKPTIDSIRYWLNPSHWWTAVADTGLGILEYLNNTIVTPISNWYNNTLKPVIDKVKFYSNPANWFKDYEDSGKQEGGGKSSGKGNGENQGLANQLNTMYTQLTNAHPILHRLSKTGASKIVSGLGQVVGAHIPAKLEMDDVYNSIVNKTGPIWSKALEMAKGIVDKIKEGLNRHSPGDAAKTVLSEFTDMGMFITQQTPVLQTAAQNAGSAIVNGVRTMNLSSPVDFNALAQDMGSAQNQTGALTTAYSNMGMTVSGTLGNINTQSQNTFNTLGVNTAKAFGTIGGTATEGMNKMKKNVEVGFNNSQKVTNTNLRSMQSTTVSTTQRMVSAWNTMRANIVNSATKIRNQSYSKFSSLNRTIGNFYNNLKNATFSSGLSMGYRPNSYNNYRGRRVYVGSTKPNGGRIRFGGGSRTTKRPHSDSYGPRDKSKEYLKLLSEGNPEKLKAFHLNNGDCIGDDCYYGTVSKNYNKILHSAYPWTLNKLGWHGYEVGSAANFSKSVREFDMGNNKKISWSQFEPVLTSLISQHGIGYEYYANGKRSNQQVWNDHLCNCWDGAELLVELGKEMGFSASMVHGDWKGEGHMGAMINGKLFDMTQFSKHGVWRGTPGVHFGSSPSRRHYGGNDSKTVKDEKTVNVHVHMENSVIYGVDDLDKRIKDSANEVALSYLEINPSTGW